MATVYGVNKTKALAPTSDNILAPGVLGGKVRVMLDSYECAATAIADIIEVGDTLPKGARIIDIILSTDDLGAAVTLSVGDYEDTNRYIDAADHSSAATHRLTAQTGVTQVGYEVDETVAATLDSQIIITIGGGAATGTIFIAILYTVE